MVRHRARPRRRSRNARRSLFYATGGLAYGSIKTTGALAGFYAQRCRGRFCRLEHRRTLRLDGRRRCRRQDHQQLERQARISLHGFRQLSGAGTFTLAPGSLDQRKCGHALPRPRPARRPELRFRRPGDREVLISALSSSRQIKAPASPGAFFVVQARKGLRPASSGAVAIRPKAVCAGARTAAIWNASRLAGKVGTGFPKGHAQTKRWGG